MNSRKVHTFRTAQVAGFLFNSARNGNVTAQPAFFEVYAPPHENDTNAYDAFVAQRCGVPVTTRMKDIIGAA